MKNTDWGGALSTFGEKYDANGKKMRVNFKYKTFGMKADQAVDLLGIPKPNYLKIDVDGIEHLILSGAGSAIEKTKEILIEINDDFIEQKNETEMILCQSGFVQKEKILLEKDLQIFNQIWVKNQAV